MTFSSKEEAMYHACKDLKAVCRDLLYAEYGEDWAKHEAYGGRLSDRPEGELYALLNKIRKFAKGEL